MEQGLLNYHASFTKWLRMCGLLQFLLVGETTNTRGCPLEGTSEFEHGSRIKTRALDVGAPRHGPLKGSLRFHKAGSKCFLSLAFCSFWTSAGGGGVDS